MGADWIDQMRVQETSLRTLMGRLALEKGGGLAGEVERSRIRMMLHERLSSMRTFLGELRGNTPEAQRDVLALRIRLELPYYSHLDLVFPALETASPSAA